MSRSRKHNIDELEQLRAENRELKSQLKSLQRQLKKLNKELRTEFDIDELVEEITESNTPKNKCSKCDKGKLVSTELGPRMIETCTLCDYRKVTKRNGKET